MILFWRHLLLLGRHLLAVIAERSWIISSDEVHCPRVYETVNVSQFTGFVIWNSMHHLCFYKPDESIQGCFQIHIAIPDVLSETWPSNLLSKDSNKCYVIKPHWTHLHYCCLRFRKIYICILCNFRVEVFCLFVCLLFTLKDIWPQTVNVKQAHKLNFLEMLLLCHIPPVRPI